MIAYGRRKFPVLVVVRRLTRTEFDAHKGGEYPGDSCCEAVLTKLPSMTTDRTLDSEATTAVTVSAETTTTASTTQPLPGLLVTVELENAINECKKKVARIAKACRAGNKKFRLVSLPPVPIM
jgi:hypothetical protein